MKRKRGVEEEANRVFFVYLLYDTRNNEIFYVGKGKGRRYFDHLKEAHKECNKETEDKKIRKIQEIGDSRFGCSILRRNLTENEALHIEASIIDLLSSKKNKFSILNVQSGHGRYTNGMIDIKQFTSLKKKYVSLLKSETLLCLNISSEEYLKESSVSQIIHSKEWKVKKEEASKASYIVVECDNTIVAVFNSKNWQECNNSNHCHFNGNIIKDQEINDRFVGFKLPKRKQGSTQSRYINYTDIRIVKNGLKQKRIESVSS